jgi:hypothetical protein
MSAEVGPEPEPIPKWVFRYPKIRKQTSQKLNNRIVGLLILIDPRNFYFVQRLAIVLSNLYSSIEILLINRSIAGPTFQNLQIYHLVSHFFFPLTFSYTLPHRRLTTFPS